MYLGSFITSIVRAFERLVPDLSSVSTIRKYTISFTNCIRVITKIMQLLRLIISLIIN
jgi:hypothetical protein